MKGWLAKGIVFFVFTGLVNALVPAVVAMVVGTRAPLDLSGLGLVDRTMHRLPWLWRWTHQMHHSAERMDLAGMTYSHPLDTVATFGVTGLAVGLLGLSPEAGALAGLIGYGAAVFQHANIRTPRFLGYLLPRPEMHGLHHGQPG